MPKIPDYREGTQLRVNNPTGIASSADDRMIGESIGAFGQGMERFGSALAEFNKQANKDKNKIQELSWGAKVEAAALKLADESRQKANPDGTNLVESYSDGFNEWLGNEVKDLPDGDNKRLLVALAQGARNKSLGDLYKESRSMHQQAKANALDENVNTYASLAVIAPDRAESYATQVESLLSEDTEIRGDERAKFVSTYRKKVAEGAITGFIRQKKWADADRALNETFAGAFDADERQKRMDSIQKAEENFYRAKHTELKRQREENKLLLEQTQNQRFNDLLGKLRSAKTPAQSLAVMEAVESARQSKELADDDTGYLQRYFKASNDKTDDKTYMKYRLGAMDKMSVSQLKRALSKEFDAGLLSRASADRLINEKQESVRRAQTDRFWTLEMRSVEKDISVITAKNGPMDGLMGEREKLQFVSDSRKILVDRLRTNPGLRPQAEWEKIKRERFPRLQSLPRVPGADFKSQDDPNYLRQQVPGIIRERKRRGEITEREAKDHLIILKNRIDYMNLLEAPSAVQSP